MTIELQDKLYTSTQVADILGVSLRTLYRYMEDGRIKSMRTASGRHRFTKDHIVDFLNAGDMNMYNDTSDGRNFGPSSVNNSYALQPRFGSSDGSNLNSPENSFINQNQPNININRPENTFSVDPVRKYSPEPSKSIPEYPHYEIENSFFAPVQNPLKNYSDDPKIDINYKADQNKPSYDSINDFDFNSIKPNQTVVEQEDPFYPKNAYNTNTKKDDFFDFEFNESEFKQNNPSQKIESSGNISKQTFQYDKYEYKQEATPVAQPSYQYDSRVTNSPISQPGPSDMSRAKAEPVDVFDLSYSNLNIRYYKSDHADLIELARKIKETGKSRDLEYAFTLYAGLSLHFLIKPFTILHYYANPEDMQIWKEDLSLTPANRKEDANIGVLVNTDIVFVPTKEIAGFKVVDDKVLLRDLSEAKEEELMKQFRQHLMSV